MMKEIERNQLINPPSIELLPKKMSQNLKLDETKIKNNRQSANGHTRGNSMISVPKRSTLIEDDNKTDFNHILKSFSPNFQTETIKIKNQKVSLINNKFDEVVKSLNDLKVKMISQVDQYYTQVIDNFDILKFQLKEIERLLALKAKSGQNAKTLDLFDKKIQQEFSSVHKFLQENPLFQEQEKLMNGPVINFDESICFNFLSSFCKIEEVNFQKVMIMDNNFETISKMAEDENLLLDCDNEYLLEKSKMLDIVPTNNFENIRNSYIGPKTLINRVPLASLSTNIINLGNFAIEKQKDFVKLNSEQQQNKNLSSNSTYKVPTERKTFVNINPYSDYPLTTPGMFKSGISEWSIPQNDLNHNFTISPVIKEDIINLSKTQSIPAPEDKLINTKLNMSQTIKIDLRNLKKIQNKFEKETRKSNMKKSPSSGCFQTNPQKLIEKITNCAFEKSNMLDLCNLDISDKNITDSIGSKIGALDFLKILKLNGNKITEIGVRILLNHLKDSKIETISLQQNDIKESVLESILVYRKGNHSLKFIDVSVNNISHVSNKVRNLVQTLNMIGTNVVI